MVLALTGAATPDVGFAADVVISPEAPENQQPAGGEPKVTPVAEGNEVGVDKGPVSGGSPGGPGRGTSRGSSGGRSPAGGSSGGGSGACTVEPAYEPADGTTVTGNGASNVRITRPHPVFDHQQGGMYRLCNGTVDAFWWIDVTPPTPQALYRIPFESVRRRLPDPTPDLSPTDRGVVNLGMWLAVAPQADVRAEIGDGALFGRVVATHTSTTFDPGNGDDPITCDGAGVPIVDVDTVDEGPCGYTYRNPSPAGEPFEFTVTTTWSIGFETSSGSGTLDPLATSSRFDYQVVEIQTVGVGTP